MTPPSPSTEPRTDRDTACAARLKVLADETRLAVLRRLMDGPLHVGEINAELEVEQSLLSHHLRVLREAGLVEARRDGKAVLYRLAPGLRGVPATERRRGRSIDLGCCKLSFD